MKFKFKIIFFILFLSFFFVLIWFIFTQKKKTNDYSLSPYPDGKNFAFTISDDPDANTLEKIKPVYDYLYSVGLKTTAAVWVFKATRTNGVPDRLTDYSPGDTCEREAYLDYMQKLAKKGFEIASHGPSAGNDRRDTTIRGYEKFKEHFGKYPKIYINHRENLENLYWGAKVVSENFLQLFLKLFLSKAKIPYSGEIPSSDYYWGDLIKGKSKYVRLFGTQNINTLAFNPSMPYHDKAKPFVNYWFAFSDGNGVNGFTNLLNKENIDKLVKERGTTIVYTHFGYPGFSKAGKLNAKVKKCIDLVAKKKDGWFVPVSTILNRLLMMKRVKLLRNSDDLLIVNFNSQTVDGVTLIVSPNETFYGSSGEKYYANKEGEIIINKILPGDCIFLSKFDRFKENEFDKIYFDGAIFLKWDGRKIMNLTLPEYKEKNILNSKEKIFHVNGEGLLKFKNDFKDDSMTIITDDKLFIPNNETPNLFEKYNLIFHRAITFYRNNYK